MPKSAFQVSSKSIDDLTVPVAGSAVSIGHAVGYNSSQIATAAAVVWGVAKNDAASGKECLIGVHGTVPAKAGAAIAVGAALTTDSSGRFVTATTGQRIFGRALQAAGAANDFFELFITREGVA